MSPRRAFALACSLFLFVYGAATAWRTSTERAGIDFYHYWAVPTLVRDAGVRNVYSPEGRASLHDYFVSHAPEIGSRRLFEVATFWRDPKPTGTPFSYAALGVLFSGDYEQSFRRFQALSLASVMASFLLLARLKRVAWPLSLAACGLASSWFEPLCSDLRVANLNRVILLLIAVFLTLRRLAEHATTVSARRAWSLAGGFALAIGILSKPLFVPVLVCIVAQRFVHRKHADLLMEAAGASVAAVIGSVVTLRLFGTVHVWEWWAQNVNVMLPERDITVGMGNYAPLRLLGEYLGASGSVLALGIAAMVFLAYVSSLDGAYDRTVEESPTDDGLAICAGLLVYCWTVRMVWAHYFVLLLPWLAFFAIDAFRQRRLTFAALATTSAFAFGYGGPLASLSGMFLLSGLLVVTLQRARLTSYQKKLQAVMHP